MRQMTVLALALILTAPLTGLAATSEPPAPLSWLAAAPSDEAASCAAFSSSGAPEVSQQAPDLLSVGEASLTCSSYCGPGTMCLGATPGTVCGAYPKIGACNMIAELCSTDGRYRCYCKYGF
jgi:hypothetical protein